MQIVFLVVLKLILTRWLSGQFIGIIGGWFIRLGLCLLIVVVIMMHVTN